MNALITGAAGGLGRAMAMECARRGYGLVLTDVSGEGLACLQEGIRRQYGVAAEIYPCDITRGEEVEGLFRFIRSRGIPLNLTLLAAGIDHEGSFLELQCQRLIDIVRVNIEGVLRVLHGALEQRDEALRFNVVVVSSLASLYPMPLKATYAASKRFLLDFSMALSQELREKHVSILTLCPGGLPTTQGAIEGIAAQGLWGRLTANSTAKVARRTITKAMRGRRLYIPGAVNRILSILGRLVPRPLLARLLYARWRQARAVSDRESSMGPLKPTRSTMP